MKWRQNILRRRERRLADIRYRRNCWRALDYMKAHEVELAQWADGPAWPVKTYYLQPHNYDRWNNPATFESTYSAAEYFDSHGR